MDDFFSATDLICMQPALTAPGERARAPSQARALAMSAASTPARPFYPATVQFDPMLRRFNLSYGPDAANDLDEAIVDRVLENGRLLLLDGPSYRTRHLDLTAEDAPDGPHQPARICGNQSADSLEPTIVGRRS